MDPTTELDRIERKIRGNEARAEATIEMHDDSLDSQFAELDYDTDVEAELEALKANVGKAAGTARHRRPNDWPVGLDLGFWVPGFGFWVLLFWEPGFHQDRPKPGTQNLNPVRKASCDGDS